jgi:hypothetical protein
MGPDEPVGSSRSNNRNRNMLIVGGLALVLVAGVVFVGVNPTGDRAGSTATDASPSPSATTAAPSPTASATDATSTPSPTATTASPSPSASTTVVTTTCAAGGACAVGDIGPGGGLVFVISGGLRYEMAPKRWSGSETPDAQQKWCQKTTTALPGTFGTLIGTGANNTVLMTDACSSGAGRSAADYAGGGKSDWFLPSKDELIAMYNYKTLIVDTATYGFAGFVYWSSSQLEANGAWSQYLDSGDQGFNYKLNTLRVRPIRAF